jgi:hypothetical protein
MIIEEKFKKKRPRYDHHGRWGENHADEWENAVADDTLAGILCCVLFRIF